MIWKTALAVLERWDQAGFQWINHTLYLRPLADATFWLADDILLLNLLLLGLVVYIWWKGWRATLILGLWSAAAVLLANIVHNAWLKPFFNRPRPFLVLDPVHLCARLGDLDKISPAFPSTHSAAAAALAVVAVALDGRLRWPAFLFAAGIGWGAVYSGGHFPGDVLAGYAVGLALGFGLRPAVKASQRFLA